MSTALRALERLGKWRSIFAGWQLGTRPLGDPESDAVRDLQEARLLLRAEVTAIVRVLLEAKVVSQERFEQVLGEEADMLSGALERKFPGMRATDDGIVMDMPRAAETMRRWKP